MQSSARRPIRTKLIVFSSVVSLGLLIVIAATYSPSFQSPPASVATGHLPVMHRMNGVLAHNFKSLSELKGASTYIVLGTVTKQTVEIGTDQMPSTISTVAVQTTIWSRPSGSSAHSLSLVEVKQFGGTSPDGAQWIDRDFPSLSKGHEYILFLTPAPVPGQYYPVGAYQGVFAVGAQQLVTSYNHQTDAAGVHVINTQLQQFLVEVNSASAADVKP